MTALCLAHFKKVRSNPAEFLKTQFKSLDCSIMELADDIAYGVHDLEDAIVTGCGKSTSVAKKHWLNLE